MTRRSTTRVGFCDPDPAVRLEDWRRRARLVGHHHIDHLARMGYARLAIQLLRLRGDIK